MDSWNLYPHSHLCVLDMSGMCMEMSCRPHCELGGSRAASIPSGTHHVEHAWLVCFAWLALACVISNPGKARILIAKSSFRRLARPNSQSNHTSAV